MAKQFLTGIAVPYAAKTGAYTTTASDHTINCDTTSAGFTVSLLTAVGNTGLRQTIKKIVAANTLTIDPNGSQTIDGATTVALTAQYDSITVQSDGANWIKVAAVSAAGGDGSVDLVWRNIATGARCPGSTQGTADDKKMSCRVHILTAAASRLRLVYVNGFTSEADGGNSTTGMGLLSIVATVAYPGKDDVVGTVTGTIPKGDVKSFDVTLSATIPAGATVYIGTFATPESGTKVPQFNCSEGSPVMNSRVNTTLGEASETAAGATNKTSAMSTIVNDGLSPYGPSAICAEVRSTTRCLLIDGDSQNTGAWSGVDAYNNRGWLGHAVANTFGSVNLSVSSRTASTAVTSNWLHRALAVAAGATHVVVTLGIGDIVASQTATQVQNSLLALWTDWLSIGVKPVAATILPDTTSTDSWATVGNQTPHANSAAIVTVNTFIRTTPGPLIAYIESAWTVESAHDSQKWAAPNYTSDGLHPGVPGTDITTARNALIAAVSLTTFELAAAAEDLPFEDNPFGLVAVSLSGAINALAALSPLLLLEDGSALLLEAGGGQLLLEA